MLVLYIFAVVSSLVLSFAAAVKTELNGSSEVEPVTVFYICMTGCLFVWLSAIALIFRHAA